MRLFIILPFFLAACGGVTAERIDGAPEYDAGPDPTADGSAQYDLGCVTLICGDAGVKPVDDAGGDAGLEPDLGVELDAGSDAGSDAGPALCVSSSDCDDGDPCTGDSCFADGSCHHAGTGTCTGSFGFPTRTDTRVVAGALWGAVGDYQEATHDVPTVPYATHIAIADLRWRGSACTSTGDFRILLNGAEIATFTGYIGSSTHPVSFDFPRVDGPTYTIRLEETTPGTSCSLWVTPAGGFGEVMTTLVAL